ncbi:hypothetical protein L7F22_026496 [Adiantum nelumboides]|nr:hypothetical protein [Adiantum nelumboides]
MSAKCGLLQKAHDMLQELPFEMSSLGMPLIAEYAQQGQGQGQVAPCDNTRKEKMLFEDRKLVWKGGIPMQLQLHNSEVTTVPPPHPSLILAPRNGYLPLLVPYVKPHFQSALPIGQDTGWFEYEGLPLKWHIPIGVLFDLLCFEPIRPWNLMNMGTTLKFSSSFHPQTDGQSEEANSTVLDLLKCYVSEHKGKWEQYLPLVEYAYNNTVHSSTGKAPFEIVEGGKKVPPILHTKDKIFEADKYVQDMNEMYKKVKVAFEKTQAKQKKAADSHRREVVFSLGDWVLLRFEKARLKKIKGKERLFPKLSMRYYGPFQVCDKISDVVYRLKLPESWRIHNAFHVSLLRPYVGDVPEDLPVEDQPEVEELDEILVPEQILAHKERKVKGKVARRYLVKFRNYPPMDAKWMEEGELAESPTVLSLYLEAFGLQPTLTP